jgi:hypothetical protein
MSRPLVAAGAGLITLAWFVTAVGLWARWAGTLEGPPGWQTPPRPLTLEKVADVVRAELRRWGLVDLTPKEVMEFTNHFYVLVVEKGTGKGAMELLVEWDGSVHPEPGPNMMWNTKYGHMGSWRPLPRGAPPVSRERARQLAQEFLAQTYPGTAADEGTELYGYFTFDVLRDGRPVGMLSVNAYTGQVWYHGWHGAFVREKEL